MRIPKLQFPAKSMSASPDKEFLHQLLSESARRHQHLCPRQVLGVRIGLIGLKELGFVDETYGLRFANSQKRLLTIVETDGCGADGVSVATDCSVGRRTLRVVDYGKVAVTLIDTLSSLAIRVSPTQSSRELATEYAPNAASRWHAYLEAYQVIPDEELAMARKVQLTRSIAEILSKPDARVICDICFEEVINERELHRDGLILCRNCAGDNYYEIAESSN